MSASPRMSGAEFCLLTPPGRGAIAVIGVRGGKAERIVRGLFQPAFRRQELAKELPLGRILFGRWGTPQGEELVVCRLQDDLVEINCHGGVAAPAAICEDLRQAGGTEIQQADWIEQNSDSDLIKAEAWQALSQTTTEKCSLILLDQWNGALARETATTVGLIAAGQPSDALENIERLLARSHYGLRLARPWRIVLVGEPNVGKSSLINRLVGYERSIVHAEPGTTRDVVTSQTALHGWQVELSDTAGQREADDSLESAGIERGRTAMQEADLIVQVFDIRSGSAQQFQDEEPIAAQDNHVILVANKCDLAEHQQRPPSCIATSATTGEGIEELINAIMRKLIPLPPQSGDAVPFTARQVALLNEAAQLLQEDQADQAMLRLAGLACEKLPELPQGFPQF